MKNLFFAMLLSLVCSVAFASGFKTGLATSADVLMYAIVAVAAVLVFSKSTAKFAMRTIDRAAKENRMEDKEEEEIRNA